MLAPIVLGALLMALAPLPPGRAQAPKPLVGWVLSCDDMPISGVTVQVQGTNFGAITDGEGRVVIFLPEGTHTLRFSRIGYAMTQLTVTVSEMMSSFGHVYLGCDQARLDRGPASSDTGGSLQTALVVRAQTDAETCIQDRVLGNAASSVAAFAFVENLVPSAGCASELAAFSVGTAPFYRAAPAWTSSMGDIQSGGLGPRLSVPLRFWIATDPGDSPDATESSLEHYLEAEDVFDVNRIGVTFDYVVQTAGQGGSVIADNCPEAIDNGLATSSWYAPDALNVYYVDQAYAMSAGEPVPAAGVSCTLDTNIIFVSYQTANPTTLAHELGHAFGLREGRGHTDKTYSVPFEHDACTSDEDPTLDRCQPPCPVAFGSDARPLQPGCQKFAATNVMDPSESVRTTFTVGQAYQMVLLTESRLNRNGYRSGPTKASCGESPTEDVHCPRLWVDP